MPEPFPVCHLNGELVPLREARISPLDRAFLFADGVYEVLPVYAGRPFRFDAHCERLARSCAAIRLADPHSPAAWRRLCADLLSANGIDPQLATEPGDAYLYLQLSRGADSIRNHAPLPDLPPTVFAFVAPWPRRAPEVRWRGVSCITTADLRWGRCDIKSVALLANVLARDLAAEAGASEAILLRDGMLTEASASSVHVVIAGEVRTPPPSAQLLPGTTRGALAEILADLGIPHAARPVSESELRSADEIWLGAATRELDAVTELDGHPVGSGLPGPLWERVDAEFQSLKRRLRGTPW
jgi:D-alanine transaminase